MKVIFGPVNSRRFGLSLGVDLSAGLKQCNFDCVYCELSAAKPMLEQKNVVSVAAILEELEIYIQKGVKFDILTLTANGEPSLYPHLKELILALKNRIKDKKILILSNGTAVLDADKFEALLMLDVVKFSLDSVLERTFFRIDRALKSVNLNLMIEKMRAFRQSFSGELVMEILVVNGLNDTLEEFVALNEVLRKISPVRVDLSTIDRPPAYKVKPVSDEKLYELSLLIDSVPVLIAKRRCGGEERLNFSEDELLKMLSLRPLSEQEVEVSFGETTRHTLSELLRRDKIRLVNLAGVNFYKA